MRRASILIVLVIAIAIAGCTTMQPTPDNPAHTALQKAKLTSLYFLETYKSQYADAEAMGKMAVEGRLAPGQLEVYRTKRALLIKVDPLIKTFASLVADGTIPSVGREQEINNILNNLLAASAKIGG